MISTDAVFWLVKICWKNSQHNPAVVESNSDCVYLTPGDVPEESKQILEDAGRWAHICFEFFFHQTQRSVLVAAQYF